MKWIFDWLVHALLKSLGIVIFQIAHEFFQWWEGLGALEFKSEIKRPEDIEDLFQVKNKILKKYLFSW